MMAATSPVAR
ncbi:hypothetical protein M6B38_181950 [Iris pallida]|uniref:Uncharacterized protein n=1 Tax=Iris pallida TaxID=29817 RepID=A0AAX6ELW8_IRIPA|nr:hypothetical protein M6B38_181950 [Iris pallida]